MKYLTLLLAILIFAAGAYSQANTIKDRDGNSYTVRKMPDGKWWMTENLKVKVPGSYCYEEKVEYCERDGRLYTWKVAQEVCALLGEGWRLPTNDEWAQLAGSKNMPAFNKILSP